MAQGLSRAARTHQSSRITSVSPCITKKKKKRARKGAAVIVNLQRGQKGNEALNIEDKSMLDIPLFSTLSIKDY